jgi:ribosomal protein S18 acetylase RimI-like enzyme
VASTQDEAWRSAYQGIIPGAELEKLINRRGPHWWDSAIRKGSRVSVLVFGDKVAGYANYGRNRARSLHFEGEIYELYLRPEFQGLGFGRRLFTAARRDLLQSGLKSMVIWALSDNESATEFYRALGGSLPCFLRCRLCWRCCRRTTETTQSFQAEPPPTLRAVVRDWRGYSDAILTS